MHQRVACGLRTKCLESLGRMAEVPALFGSDALSGSPMVWCRSHATTYAPRKSDYGAPAPVGWEALSTAISDG